MPAQPVPIPIQDPIVNIAPPPQTKDGDEPRLSPKPAEQGLLTDKWALYLSDMETRINRATSVVVTPVQLTGLHSSIAGTDMTGGGVNAGLYRISYYACLTTAAGTSSSLQVSFTWTRSGVARTLSTTAYTGNSITAPLAGSFLIFTDGASPINYSTTYASVGAPAMVYELSVTLEKVSL